MWVGVGGCAWVRVWDRSGAKWDMQVDGKGGGLSAYGVCLSFTRVSVCGRMRSVMNLIC